MVPFLSKPKRRRRSVRRDFSAPQQRAPETVTKLSRAYREPAKGRWGLILGIALGVAAVAGLLALAFSPIMQVRNIVVSAVSSQAAEQRIRQLVMGVVQEKPLGVLPAGSLAFFRSAKAREAIQQEFYVETVRFSRHWPNVLKVSLPANVVVAEWQTEEALYLVDRRGVLVQQVGEAGEDMGLLRIVDAEDEPRNLGDQVLSEREVQFVDNLFLAWRTSLDDVRIGHLLIEHNSLPTIKVFTQAGWYALVSSESDTTIQVVALRRLLDEKLKEQQDKLMYVDVRFGSRLYYKLK